MQLFLDCDGVLADFDHLAEQIFGMQGDEYEAKYGSNAFWARLEEHGSFFESLPLMPDAMRLWNAVKHLRPIILTGTPRGNWSQPQKLKWAARHFPEAKMITCRSADKWTHMEQPGDILVDDFLKYRHLWIEKGGIFVHHTSAEDSLKQLAELGVELEMA